MGAAPFDGVHSWRGARGGGGVSRANRYRRYQVKSNSLEHGSTHGTMHSCVRAHVAPKTLDAGLTFITGIKVFEMD